MTLAQCRSSHSEIRCALLPALAWCAVRFLCWRRRFGLRGRRGLEI